ncbi:hypothetical protein [Priestia megaterium]|uniref:hypothetical protein n=1 Tax=Priestia megaterium TaxID=1404 RepID=UPI00186938E8|nr:hypothetical protein [Priestia megaterium]MBE2977805.1 hypothetical protein [Priestia megaterium]
MIGSAILDGVTQITGNFLLVLIIIGLALTLIPIIMYLSKWLLNGKEMKKEWSSFNEEEKKQEQLNILKYLMPFIIVTAIIFVFISATTFIGGAAK